MTSNNFFHRLISNAFLKFLVLFFIEYEVNAGAVKSMNNNLGSLIHSFIEQVVVECSLYSKHGVKL